jgi:hypothetical protein
VTNLDEIQDADDAEYDLEVAQCCGGRDWRCGHYRA